MTFRSFEDRLDNWGRTVRTSPNRDRACAWWAEMYVKIRDIRTGALPFAIDRDELDGWLVEEAWKHLPNHVSKWMLRYHFVFGMSREQVQTRLWRVHHIRLRGHQFEVGLKNAQTAIGHEIVKISGWNVLPVFPEISKKICKLEELFI